MKIFASGIISLSLLSPLPVWGMNIMGYAEKVVPYNLDDATRSTLLGIVDSCGTPTNVDDDCVLKGLERVAIEENNTIASIMLQEYARAIGEGRFSTEPECHVETHLQANRILAHCTLLLNYSALKDQNTDTATAQFNMCLQGGLQGLVFQGNIVAQYMLSQFYIQKGIIEAADTWRRALLLRKDTPEYALLINCYVE